MTSSDIRADGSRPGIHAQPPLREVVVATVRLGIALFVRENPIRPVVFSSWFRAVCLSLLFTLLGVAAGGAAAGDFSFIGSIILVGSEEVIGLTSDVPMRDRIDGTYWRVRASRLPPFATFALRVFPVIGAGLASSAVAAVTVGLLTGRLPLVLSLLPAFPLALVSLLSGAAVGLFVIAPAIGTRYDTLTYNTMTALLAVFSGALIPRGTHGAFDAVGEVLPLTHAIDGIRAMLAGRPWLADLGLELLVGAAWALIAALTYAAMDRRGIKTGSGAFDG